MRFILTLLLIYAAWQLLKFVFRFALLYWVKKNAGKAFQFNGQFGSADFNQNQRKEGEIRVESSGNSKKPGRSSGDEGEYVEFEEVS